MDKNIKAFVIHISSRGLKKAIYLAKKAKMVLLFAKEVTISAKYLDFVNVFLKDLANIFPEQTKVNEHAIKLKKSKKALYRPIYSLGPVELKTFKIYIKTNLANGFIKASKSPASTPILFLCKPNGSFYLCVDYSGLNNLTIKNKYLLLLISELLDRLDQAKRFIILDLTNAYYWIRIKEGNEWKTVF